MPNVKLFVERNLVLRHAHSMDALLVAMRHLLSEHLAVPPAACHLVVIELHGLPDQPPVNVELHVLPRPERTPERMREICTTLRDMVAASLGAAVAVRCAMLDPQTYVVLK